MQRSTHGPSDHRPVLLANFLPFIIHSHIAVCDTGSVVSRTGNLARCGAGCLVLASELCIERQQFLVERIKQESKELFCILLMPAAHGVESALGFEGGIKAAGDEGVPPRVGLLAVFHGLSALRNFARFREFELAEESDHRVRQGCALAILFCSAAHNRTVADILAEFRKNPPEGWAVDQHLQNHVRKAHVPSVDESSGADLHRSLRGGLRDSTRGEELQYIRMGPRSERGRVN